MMSNNSNGEPMMDHEESPESPTMTSKHAPSSPGSPSQLNIVEDHNKEDDIDGDLYIDAGGGAGVVPEEESEGLINATGTQENEEEADDDGLYDDIHIPVNVTAAVETVDEPMPELPRAELNESIIRLKVAGAALSSEVVPEPEPEAFVQKMDVDGPESPPQEQGQALADEPQQQGPSSPEEQESQGPASPEASEQGIPADPSSPSPEKLQEEESQDDPTSPPKEETPSSPSDHQGPASPVASSPPKADIEQDSNGAVASFDDAKAQGRKLSEDVVDDASQGEGNSNSVSQQVEESNQSEVRQSAAEEESQSSVKASEQEESMDTSGEAETVKSAKGEDVDPEDLEEGELEESDEEEGVSKTVPAAAASKDKGKKPESILELEKKQKKLLEELEKSKQKEREERKRKEREREKEKEREREKREREKEKKKRRHSDEDKDKDNKHSSSKRKREDESDRSHHRGGASPSNVKAEDRHEETDRRRHRDDQRDERPMGRRGGPPGRRDDFPPRPAKSDTICSYFMQGKCQKSADECNFSHDATPPRKYELCKFWMMDCCAKKEKCLYLHNDFPCKFYHTGLVCKEGPDCKFSHNPLSEQTRVVLLKHIETAPKEILGDFPRLSRQGAINLISKMEARIAAGQRRQNERERGRTHFSPPHHNNHQGHGHGSPHDDRGRRSRWEQPNKDDNDKLQELMQEAGIANYYNEATEAADSQSRGQGPPKSMPLANSGPGLLPTPPMVANHALPPPPGPNPFTSALSGMLASMSGPNPGTNPLLTNPLLANPQQLLQSLLPAFGSGGPTAEQLQAAQLLLAQQLLASPASTVPQPDMKTEMSSMSPTMQANGSTASASSMDIEHLPKMQQDLFKRIQSLQSKKQNEVKTEPEDDAPPPDDNWYSSDEEDRGSKADRKPSLNSILTAIRQGNQNEDVKPFGNNNVGDVDLRSSSFGDMDFRLPPLRQSEALQDVDLRSGRSSDGFKKVPDMPAQEIFAGPSSHSGITWKVRVVAGVRPIDYSYARNTLQPSQILCDPRLNRKMASSSPSGPASPPPAAQRTSPISDFVDPRKRRGAPKEPRSSTFTGHESPGQGPPPNSMPNPFNPFDAAPPSIAGLAQMMQAAMAATGHASGPNAFMPNLQPNPFVVPDLSSITAAAQAAAAALQQQNASQSSSSNPRPPFHQPKSSWETRYQQQGSGGVTPPI